MPDLITTALDTAHHITLAVPDPSEGGGEAPPGSGKITKVLKWAFWVVSIVCVLGVLGVGGKLALAWQRGEGSEAMSGLGKVLAACCLIGMASGLVGALI
ncbi:hypothetical protein ABZ383_22655 [Streptomyces sp. NPDC005900]|uniref:hypothetical protein n=1 Tax=Streptomyces sp. NPDC005900 TaxID=3154569 RepID=UPI0033F9B0C3